MVPRYPSAGVLPLQPNVPKLSPSNPQHQQRYLAPWPYLTQGSG